MRPLDFLLDLLFPPKCVFCGRLLHREEAGFCAACQKALPWCLGPSGEQKPEFISLCASPLWYQGAVRESFHRYKFQGAQGYARTYGALMAQCVRDHLDGRYDLVTWVPLSPRRRRKRGYDQALLLARQAAEVLGTEVTPTLKKVRHTQAQSGLSGGGDGARRANVLGAYEALDPALVDDRRVLLIDDIVTTGSTLSECARILRTAGAAEVVACTLARAKK